MWMELNYLRDVSMMSVLIRMLLAVFCGGVIGLERSCMRRPAGLRTHLLICLGACITTMTSQFLVFTMNYQTDITRLGAQVVSGVGFIGAGTIIVVRSRRIKGLTTAAGLWTNAIIGLAIGAAYYEVAVCATILVLIAELFFSKLEFYLTRRMKSTTLYAEYESSDALQDLFKEMQIRGATILDVEIGKSKDGNRCAVFTIYGYRRGTNTLLAELALDSGITLIERL